MIVADTNVIAYLLIKGDHTPKAQAAFAKEPLWVAPLAWRSEFCNVLVLYMRHGHMGLQDALRYMRQAQGLMRDGELLIEPERVLRLAETCSLAAYDCEFVALAQKLGLKLLTCDARILREFPGTAFSLDGFVP